MGIDIHALNFLRYATRKRYLGATMTIGRQGVHVIEPVVRKALAFDGAYQNADYCEQLLIGGLGATSVESVDNSSYEGATHVHDMNQELPEDLRGRFDTVIDGGCVEHVFNVVQALRNCSSLLKPGGQVLHVLPANNFCGHGFWQFSPELFFSLYSASNGYGELEVLIADLTDASRWYRVRKPEAGRRANVWSKTPLYVLVRAVLVDGEFSHRRVQQSDYVHAWEGGGVAAQNREIKTEGFSKLKSLLKRSDFLYGASSGIRRRFATGITRLSANPSLVEVDVESAIASV